MKAEQVFRKLIKSWLEHPRFTAKFLEGLENHPNDPAIITALVGALLNNTDEEEQLVNYLEDEPPTDLDDCINAVVNFFDGKQRLDITL